MPDFQKEYRHFFLQLIPIANSIAFVSGGYKQKVKCLSLPIFLSVLSHRIIRYKMLRLVKSIFRYSE